MSAVREIFIGVAIAVAGGFATTLFAPEKIAGFFGTLTQTRVETATAKDVNTAFGGLASVRLTVGECLILSHQTLIDLGYSGVQIKEERYVFGNFDTATGFGKASISCPPLLTDEIGYPVDINISVVSIFQSDALERLREINDVLDSKSLTVEADYSSFSVSYEPPVGE